MSTQLKGKPNGALCIAAHSSSRKRSGLEILHGVILHFSKILFRSAHFGASDICDSMAEYIKIEYLELVNQLKEHGLSTLADAVLLGLHRVGLIPSILPEQEERKQAFSNCRLDSNFYETLLSHNPFDESVPDKYHSQTYASITKPIHLDVYASSVLPQDNLRLLSDAIYRLGKEFPVVAIHSASQIALDRLDKLNAIEVQRENRRNGPVLFFRLRDWRRGSKPKPLDVLARHSMLLEAVAFEHWAPLLFRRITVYCHQYLEFEEIPAGVPHIRWNSTGTSFVSAADDGVLKVWDSHTGRLCYTVRRHFSDITDLDICFDDIHVSTISSSNELRLWRFGPEGYIPLDSITLPALPTFIRFFPPLYENESGKALLNASDGTLSDRFLLSTCDDSIVRLYDLRRFHPLKRNSRAPWSFSSTQTPGVLNFSQAGLAEANSRETEGSAEPAFDDSVTDIQQQQPLHNINLGNFVPRTIDMFRHAIPVVSSDLPEQLTPDVQLDMDTLLNGSGLEFTDYTTWRPAFKTSVYFALGLQKHIESENGTPSMDISNESNQTDSCLGYSSLAICRVVLHYNRKGSCISGASDAVLEDVSTQVLHLPLSAVGDVHDVAFASLSPRLLSANNTGSVLLWHFTDWNNDVIKLPSPPLNIKTGVMEKLENGEYKVYQHPLSRCGRSNGSELNNFISGSSVPSTRQAISSERSAFTIYVTALSWGDSDRVALVGTSVGRTMDKCDVQKMKTKETEIAVIDSSTGFRLFSIMDRRELKSNISFLRANPIVSSLVIAGTFCGQLLLLDVRSRRILEFIASQTSQSNGSSLTGVFNPITRFFDSITPCAYSTTTTYHPIVKRLSFAKASFLDGQWAPSGKFFVVSQLDGCISIFTTNGCSSVAEVMKLSDSYQLSSCHQFFENDFCVLQNDFPHIVDPFSDIPAHQFPRGPIVDCRRIPLHQTPPIPTAHFDKYRRNSLQNVPVDSVTLVSMAQKMHDLGRWISAESHQRLDPYLNVATSISHSPSTQRSRVPSSSQSGRIRSSSRSPDLRVNLQRYRTLLSTSLFINDETDSSWQDSDTETNSIDLIAPASHGQPSDYNEVRNEGDLSSSDEEDSSSDGFSETASELSRHSNSSLPAQYPSENLNSREVLPFRRISRSTCNVEICNNIVQEQIDTPAFVKYQQFWEGDPTRRLKGLMQATEYIPRKASSLGIDVNSLVYEPAVHDELIYGIPRSRLQLMENIEVILEKPTLLEAISPVQRQRLFDRCAAASRSHRLEQRRLRRGDGLGFRKLTTGGGGSCVYPIEEYQRSTAHKDSDADTRRYPQRQRRTLQSNVDERIIANTYQQTFTPEHITMTAWVEKYLAHFKFFSAIHNVTPLLLNSPFARLGSVSYCSPQLLDSRAVVLPSSQTIHLLECQLLAFLTMARFYLNNNLFDSPFPFSCGLRSICELFSEFPFPLAFEVVEEFSLQSSKPPSTSQIASTTEFNCFVCLGKGHPLPIHPVNPLLLAYFLFPGDLDQRDTSHLKSYLNVKKLDEKESPNSIFLIFKSLQAKSRPLRHCLKCSISAEDLFSLLRSQHFGFQISAYKRIASWLTNFDGKMLEDGFLLGPLNLSSLSNESNSSRDVSRPSWVHSECFLSSFCNITEDGILMFPTSDHMARYTGDVLKKKICSFCSKPNALVACHYCDLHFHWSCSQEKWKESESERLEVLHPKALRNFPNNLTWPYYVCPKLQCKRHLRQKKALMIGELFATPSGILSRNWLLRDKRIQGDYVPQLGDFVRLFPSEILKCEYQVPPLALYSGFLPWLACDGIVVNIDFSFPGLRSIERSSGTHHQRNKREEFYIIAIVSFLIFPPHPLCGRIIKIPYSPAETRPFVLLSEVLCGLKRLQTDFKVGDRVQTFFNGSFQSGTIRQLRYPDSESAMHNSWPEWIEILHESSTYKVWEQLIEKQHRQDGPTIQLWMELLKFMRPEFGLSAVLLEWDRNSEEPTEANEPLRKRARVHSVTTHVLTKVPPSNLEYFNCWEVFLDSCEQSSVAEGKECIPLDRRQLFEKVLTSVMARTSPELQMHHMVLRRHRESSRSTVCREYEIFCRQPKESVSENDWEFDYWKTIELPISLDLIRRRVANNYYRSEASFFFDLQLLFSNCRRFNGEFDLNTTLAERLLSNIVEDIQTIDVNPINGHQEFPSTSSTSKLRSRNRALVNHI